MRPPGRHVDIPDTLKDTLMSRLDRLGPAKEVAQIGAVIGREFPTGYCHGWRTVPRKN